MEGTIIKIVRGLYYVDTKEGIIPCKARGLFREKDITPLVGDRVTLRISDEDGSGYIESIMPRRNELLRPAVANIDSALIVFSIRQPMLNTYLLDKNLLMTEHYGIDTNICFTKSDLNKKNELDKYVEIYKNIGYNVFVIGKEDMSGLDLLVESLQGKTTSVSGPSGVGKSTLINHIDPKLELETSKVSVKTERGRHTTRHIELIPLNHNTYILDTPGFSSLALEFIMDEKEVSKNFIDFRKYSDECQFLDCMHINEPNCAIKEKIGSKIHQSRYDNYLLFIDEIKKTRRY